MTSYKLHGVRVFADDVPAAADFYAKHLGMQIVTQMDLPGAVEILLNGGASVAEAAANPMPFFVVMSQPDGAPEDFRAHAVLEVEDVDGVAESFAAAGGAITFGPETFNGVRVAFVKDPFGNVLEFLKVPPHA